MRWPWYLALALGAPAVAVAACSDDYGSAGESTPGQDASTPLSESGAAAGDGAVGACATPPHCTSDGVSLVTCDGMIACGLGCDVPTSQCKAIAPSGAVGTAATTAATANAKLDAADTYYADTTTGVIGFRDEAGQPKGAPLRGPGSGVVSGIGWELVAQADGAPKVAVFSFGTLTIGPAARLQVVGPDAVAFVTQGDLVIDGTLTVRGDCAANTPGPGVPVAAQDGGVTVSGGVGEATRTGNGGFNLLCGGGGGGSNGAAGGRGGEASGTTSEGVTSYASGGPAGTVRAKTLIDRPILVGGGSGGAGGSRDGNVVLGVGGAAGGAIQLVASGSILVSGTIDAGGCGGKASILSNNPIAAKNCVGAGGGGAGGTIFFEAIAVKLSAAARVLANGGGGGGGQTDYNPVVHTDGAINATDATPAPGGTSDASLAACGNGQAGNPGSDSAVSSCGPTMKPVAAGGGGGGLGHIALRTKDSAIVIAPGAIMNPAATRGYVVVK